MVSQLFELGLLVIGVVLVMILGNGGIDLFGIGLVNLVGVVVVVIMLLLVVVFDVVLWIYILGFIVVVLVIGLVGGVFNGWLILCGNLMLIFCMLGMQMIFIGLVVVLINGFSLCISVVDLILVIGNELVLGVLIFFIIFVVLLLGVGWLMCYSLFGIKFYLLGINVCVVCYVGILQNCLCFVIYILSGVLVLVVGVIIVVCIVSVKVDYGNFYLFIVILIVVMVGICL